MRVLGISAFYHDSAAALIEGDTIVAAAQEERFTRRKHDSRFPSSAIRFCLDWAGLPLDSLDAVVFYDKPLLKFERLLETYHAYAPRGLRQFVTAMPVWVREKLFLRKLIRDELAAVHGSSTKKIKLLFCEHHLSHAASAFFASPFEEAAILTLDGVGEWATGSISHGKGNTIRQLRELRFPHSLGLLYSAFTHYLGFKVNSGEYKLMGLAPYGNPVSSRVDEYIRIIKEKLVRIADDGSIWMDMSCFDYATGLTMIREGVWEKLFGFETRTEADELQAHHCDLALAIQKVTEEIVLKTAAEALRLTGARNVCLAGGVALNCVANGALLRSGMFDGLWIQPAAGDAGGALGAALAVRHIHFGQKRETDGNTDRMRGAYLGPEFSDKQIEVAARKYQAPFERHESFDALTARVAGLMNEGKVVGWFQGRMEWGPRALGNRSIIGDARNPEMQKKLNLKIKFREGFRPFAPSVLMERASDYFEMHAPSPYMLLVADVVKSRRHDLPGGYHDLDWRDKLYYLRSDIPAITHIDFSARLQTIHRETNPRYWAVGKAFEALTGYGVFVNTSFNVRGEPIVCTPDDAYKCFMRTDMDCLVMGDCFFDKSLQPEWNEVGWTRELD
ncbi:MAG: carbamoyltransferase [Deltaproteobacteria bacterium]|nr:carbamoyltransferase [Deltaproteobacteria bacterium]